MLNLKFKPEISVGIEHYPDWKTLSQLAKQSPCVVVQRWKAKPAKRIIFNNWKKCITCLFVFCTHRICPCKIEATLPALLCKFLTNNNACWTIDRIDQLYRYIYFSGWREYYYNSCEITITWESARFIRIESIQESFIIWAYILYIFTIQW